MRKRRLLFVLIGLCGVCSAQDFSIRMVERAGDFINVYYDLLDTTDIGRRVYTVTLYSSKDNFILPLTKVSGDVGQMVRPGGNKRIVWNAREELGPDFEGKVGLEVRGKLFIPFVRIQGFGDHLSRKRGVKFDMIWSGGRANSLINFELYKNGKFIAAPHINVAASVGKQTIVIPARVKPGRGYQFKISDSRNKEEYVYTEEFTLKRKIPLLYTIAAPVVVGVVVYFLLPEPTRNIPDPPDIGNETGKQ